MSERSKAVSAAQSAPAPAIEVQRLCHAFGEGSTRVEVLHDLELSIQTGEVVTLVGPSGSGKTTLLTLVGCLRAVQSGSLRLLGTELRDAGAEDLVRMRRRLGFIFQLHNLHGSLTASQNVAMGLEVHASVDPERVRAASRHALELVGLGDRVNFLPAKLSGGQKQRVAVARALVGNPEVVFADEPTAALDKDTSQEVVTLLRALAEARGTTVLIVTHDHRILDAADRIIAMEDGHIVSGGTVPRSPPPG